jgi:nickel superoxide dismutase
MECDMKLSKALSPLAVLIALGLVLGVQSAQAHCQVPCGIFDDKARVKAMMEDAVTVDKATTEMAELQGKTDPQSVNQMVRWVINKESHAHKIISTISDYFLTQRVKPSQEDYVERLKKHHAVMLAAMKAKQHADKEHAEAVMAEITALARYYPEQ